MMNRMDSIAWKSLRLTLLAVLSVGYAAIGSSHAQTHAYPAKPIRWIVPYGAGSPLDTNVRKIASVVAQKVNGTIVVDNRGGASGTIGSNAVARSAPDGYTFLVTIADPLIASTALIRDMPYDPAKDFTFITKFTVGYPPLVIRAGAKIETLPQLIQAAKSQKLTYASMGPGSFQQVLVEELSRVAGIKITEIAYKSPPDITRAVIAGEVDISSLGPVQSVEFAKAGKLFLLGATGRSPLFPHIPSFAEAGFKTPILTTPLWVGILGPARMPRELVDRTLTSIKSAFDEDELKSFFRTGGSEIVVNTPAAFEREFQAEFGAVIPLIKALGITPQ